MKVFWGLPNAECRAPCALTIGNFDGVHRGHQALLARVRAAADARGLPVCVMTFEPHPREFFNPAGAPPRIAMLRDKLEALRLNGVDRVVVEHFNHTFASQSPAGFVERVLVQGLHTRWVMVGDDFCYGAKRAGDFAALKLAGEHHGFEVEQMETIADPLGVRISSSAVRAVLVSGQLDQARQLLGREYTISGHVVHGAKLGRELGFPTLNLRIAHKRPALTGIFAVRVHGLDDSGLALPAVASLGLRPTVDESGRYLLEVFVLDWHGNAYGRRVQVEFLKKLRDEEKYVDLPTLTAAITHDVVQTRAFFAAEASMAQANAPGGPGVAVRSATDRIS